MLYVDLGGISARLIHATRLMHIARMNQRPDIDSVMTVSDRTGATPTVRRFKPHALLMDGVAAGRGNKEDAHCYSGN
jgi:hypothetical protein